MLGRVRVMGDGKGDGLGRDIGEDLREKDRRVHVKKEYKALRSAGGLRRPLRSLRKEKVHQNMRSEQRSTIEFSFFKDRNCKPAV